MSTSAPPHRPCADLERQSEELDDDAVHRFVLGEDAGPRRVAAAEADGELGDPFAQRVLLAGTFPRTAGEVLTALEGALPADDPLRVHRFFLVGEGSQIPPGPDARAVRRNLRFLVSCGAGRDGPDILLSALHPDQGTVELMAWDHRAGGFNFYRTVGGSSAWVFAGNSRHALTPPTRGNGAFESHVAGHVVMKELRLPWVNWHSSRAPVASSVLAEEGLGDHPWVGRLAPGGAKTLQLEVAMPAIVRWTRARLAALVSGDAAETPRRILEHVLDTPTVNLISSQTRSDDAVNGVSAEVDLPDTFFVDSAALGVVGLQPPATPSVSSAIYGASLERLAVTLTDDAEFSRSGDTHFAFVVPEPAFEDSETLRQAIERGVVSRRLAACLLMVDFPNPLFSPKRRRLLDHVPSTAVGGGAEAFADRVADAILSSEEARRPGTAEHEFAERWAVGDAFEGVFNDLLRPYYAAVERRLTTQEGFDDYMRLAESRRAQVRRMPISESPLLFARMNVPSRERAMSEEAMVEEV